MKRANEEESDELFFVTDCPSTCKRNDKRVLLHDRYESGNGMEFLYDMPAMKPWKTR